MSAKASGTTKRAQPAKKTKASATKKVINKAKTTKKAKTTRKKKVASVRATKPVRAAASTATLRIEQIGSGIGCPRPHREVLRSLGLRRIRHVVERPDLPAVRGMVAKIPHLARVIGEER